MRAPRKPTRRRLRSTIRRSDEIIEHPQIKHKLVKAGTRPLKKRIAE